MSDFEYEGSSSSTSAVFDPLYAAQKQLRERMNQQPAVISARSARVGNTAAGAALNARRQSGGGANGSNNAGNASPAGASGVGSAPPEPQRNEPDDLTESEGTVDAGVDTGAAHNADATASLDEKTASVEEAHHDKQSNESSDAQQPQQSVERVYEPAPMALRHRDGSEILTTIEGDVRFTFDGDATRPRDLPAIIVQAIRDELTRLGAPELGAAPTPKTQSKTLSSGSLITALAMSALDIEIPGVDENTRRAAEVLRTGQGRVAAIEMKVEQVLDNQQRAQKDLDVMTKRALSAEKQLYELELMLTWLLVDKTEPRLFNQATATSIDLTHKTVVDARAKLRDKARELSKDESVQRGNLKIVE
jgi:hypothetical protein